ncbi:MAG: DUF2156 domain-containing protein [Nitrospirota bacterium]|nr:DUF2156 domain-containing protein [Nitrospirota bacterium]
MDMARRHDRLTLLPQASLPQCVPSRACFSCDVCCRFPEADSFLRPYFTAEEIRGAVAHGLDPARFPDPGGSQIHLVPNPSGEGYLCPAFDPVTSHCRIYDHRPLDCQIYPLALMWSADRREALLGWDTKCPFLRDSSQGLDAHAERIAALLEGDEMAATLARNPRLIGRFQDDVVVLRSLPKLTERIRSRFEVPGSGFAAGPPRNPRPVSRTLHPLTLDDRPRFEAALALVDTPLAHYAFAPHFIWRGLLDYGWTEIAGHLCLFAASPDGLFMPLPPLLMGRETGSRSEVRGSGHPVPRTPLPDPSALSACFEFMRKSNGGSGVSRVENVPAEWVSELQALGYVLKSKAPDYLYRTEDLAGLAGDRYKSQRATCNRFARTQTFRYAPYRDDDRARCMALYDIWTRQQEARSLEALDRTGRWMLQDSASAHAEALAHHRALGLTGRVIGLQDRVGAYTFGYARSASVYCVLLEVADRSVPGLAQFIFREVCREAAAQGYPYINTMDDSGLPGLARSKQAYHPVNLVSGYVACE